MKKVSNPPPQGEKPPAPPAPPSSHWDKYPYCVGRIAAITEFERMTPSEKIKRIREALLDLDAEIFDTPEEKHTRRILKDVDKALYKQCVFKCCNCGREFEKTVHPGGYQPVSCPYCYCMNSQPPRVE